MHDNFSEAFRMISVEVALTNTTTNTSVKQPGAVSIVEFEEQSLTLEVPIRTCAQGHNLLIEMKIVSPGSTEPISFSATAKAEEVEKTNGTERIHVSFVQFDEEEWKNVLLVFSSRQQEIEDFLKSSRGY
jgi:hypothetical protein